MSEVDSKVDVWPFVVENKLPDEDYQSKMDLPMGDLATALWGIDSGPEGLEDWQIVEIAAEKIKLLQKMIIATGFKEDLLKAIMEE